MITTLITAEELATRLGEVRLYDLRWSVDDPHHGIAAYRDGHLPGAVFVDLDNDLSGQEGDGRHPLPSINEFTATLGRLGASRDDEIVVYDDTGGTIAARMWWMLTVIGHEHVSLLDGGLRAWSAVGLPLQTEVIQPEPTVYSQIGGFTGVVDNSGLEGRQVVDVRAGARYRGEFEPIDPKAGHIPGAINIPVGRNLSDSGHFRPAEELKVMFATLDADVVLSCGSGVNACLTALAMSVAGLGIPDIYVGSFSDWATRDLPVRTGPNP